MSSPAAPLLVIVPGAFGTPDGFDKLKPHLGGLQTRPGPNLSCQPKDAKAVTCRDDIAALRDNILLPLLEGGNDVVIIAHSYGGIVAGGAAKGLDRDARKAHGRDTAVLGLVYVAGNISLENESLLKSIGGEFPPFVKLDKPAEGLSLIEPAMEILYNDCDSSLKAELEETVKPHALRAFDTEPTAPAWADAGFNGRRLYVRTLLDKCNPLFVQDLWMEKSKVKWETVDIEAGHMPFVSQPEKLGAIIVDFIDKIRKL